MSQAYAPSLIIAPWTSITRVRELPLPGESLVKKGDLVRSKDAVLQAMLPGDVTIIRVADRLGLDPVDVVDHIKVKVGQCVQTGDLLCEVKTFFGIFSNRLECNQNGTIEFITTDNAHIGIRHEPEPIQVKAYISGKVVDTSEGNSVTVETEGTLIQGVFGVGGHNHGTLRHLDIPNETIVTKEILKEYREEFRDSILVGGAQYTTEALEFARSLKVNGVITGSIDAQTLKNFIGHEIGVSITGHEDVPFTLIITEGFGNLPINPSIMKLTQEISGKEASINGATQVRAGAMRPEIIIPLEEKPAVLTQDEYKELKPLVIGGRFRAIRAPYFGQFGTIVDLPNEPENIESGAKVRVLEAELDSGTICKIPRANIELV